MNITIGVANYNHIDHFKKFMENILATTTNINEIIVFDNGSKDDFYSLIDEYEYPIKFIQSDKNIGIPKAYNQITKHATSKWIAFFHNDITILENKWDEKVDGILNKLADKKIGIIGFAGAKGISKGGMRLAFASNLTNAEGHGRRMTELYMNAIVIEGAALICNHEMLKKAGGFYESDCYHYPYDYDISLASIKAGYFNLVVPIYFEHISGVTYATPEFAKEFPKTEEVNKYAWELWDKRWGNSSLLPSVALEEFVVLGGALR